MKNSNIVYIIAIILLSLVSGCAVVEGIFKVGMGVGIFITVAIVVAFLYLFNRFGRK